MNSLTHKQIKYLLEYTQNMNSIVLIAFLEGNELYEKITFLMSDRLKEKFDINYQILKHKNITQDEIKNAYKEVEVLLNDEAYPKKEKDFQEYEFSLNSEEEPTAIEYYISLFLNQEASRYSGLNALLNDCINEESLESCSNIELLLKVKALKKESSAYINKDDYLLYQLPKLIQEENNELFQSVFQLLKDTPNEKNYHELFTQYENRLLEKYNTFFEYLNQFIQHLFKPTVQATNTSKRDVHECLESYSLEAFETVLSYYLYKIKSEDMFAIEKDVMFEENSFIKKFFDDYILSGVRQSSLKELLALEKNSFFKQFQTKVLIIKYGLYSCVNSFSDEPFDKSDFYCDVVLKQQFEPQITDELFKFLRS